MATGVYEIRNKVNGKTYIGSAVDMAKRLYEHFRRLRRNEHENPRLQNAFNKYGEAAFVWSPVEEVADVSLLVPKEQAIIDARRPFYNICRTAGSRLGTRHTEATKAKIRTAKTGVRPTDGTRRKMSAAQMGRRHPEEVCAKISAARVGQGNGMFGKLHSADALAKIKAASVSRRNTPETLAALAKGHGWNRGIPFSAESRKKMSEAKPKKPVKRIDPLTGEVRVYESARQAVGDEFHASHVSECCRGRQATHMGYVWRFLETEGVENGS